MNYSKPALSVRDQAQQLLDRGMVGDLSTMISRLESVNYYRLTGYWFPFRQPDPDPSKPPLDDFRPGTLFEQVWERYVFDRQLRLLVIDAIERVEIAVRTQLAYHHAHQHGPFAYALDRASLPAMKWEEFLVFPTSVGAELKRSKETFISHFRSKYGDTHGFPPVWMAAEIMSFGTILSFYRGASHRVRQDVASVFGMPETVFESWMLTLNTVRNICAHHGRLWNRELGVKPKIPLKREYPDWHQPVQIANDKAFGFLTILRYCLGRVAPQSQWAERFRSLLTKHPMVPRPSMGMPPNWEASALWK